MGDEYVVEYNLARTMVRLDATAATRKNLATGEVERSTTVDLEVATEADPRAVARLELHEGKLSDKSVTLKFAPDGRLLSTDASATGRLGEVIRGGVQVVTTVAALVAKAFLAGTTNVTRETGDGTETVAKPADPMQEAYARAHPELAAIRMKLRDAAQTVVGALADAAANVPAVDGAEAEDALLARIARLDKALDAVRAEQEVVEQHFNAWKTTAAEDESKAYTFYFDVSELPRLEDSLPQTWDLTRPLSEDVEKCLDTIGVMVAVVDAGRTQDPHAAPAAGPAIHYRYPRRVDLGIYVKETDDAKARPVLTKVVRAQAFDRYSRLGSFALGSPVFGEETVSVTVGADGSLEKLANTTKSPVAAAVNSLKELPSDVSGALESAGKILEQERKLSTARVDRRIGQLEQDKKLLEAEIALAGLSASKSQKVELDKVKSRIELLKNKKELADLG